MDQTETTTKKNGKTRHVPNLAAGAAPEQAADSPLEGEVKPRRGRKQPELPGVERTKIRAVENAAIAYEAVRDERMEATQREVAAKAKLAELLRQHGIPSYRFHDGEEEVVVEVKIADAPVETVKVKRKPRGEEE